MIKQFIAGLLIAAASMNSIAADKKHQTQSEKRFEECRQKLIKAQKLGVLHDLTLEKIGARVVAGPTFYNISFDAKEGFAETVNCLLMAGEQGKCMQFEIYNWQTGKNDAHYHNCKLKMD